MATNDSTTSDHVHDCTGLDMTCPCGFVFRVPPVAFSLTIDNGNTEVVYEYFNCETYGPVIAALREAADRLEATESGSVIDVPCAPVKEER